MKRLQRWYVGQYNYHGAPDSGGKWCESNDVSELETKYAQLEAINAELKAEIERLTGENKRLVDRSNWLNKQKEDMIEYQRHRERMAWQALEKLGGIPPKETP